MRRKVFQPKRARLLCDLANRGKAKVRISFEKLKELGQPFARGLRVWLSAHGQTLTVPELLGNSALLRWRRSSCSGARASKAELAMTNPALLLSFSALVSQARPQPHAPMRVTPTARHRRNCFAGFFLVSIDRK